MNSYDLSVTDVTWVIVNKEHVGLKLPPDIKVGFVDGQRKLEDLLVEGKVDAELNRIYRSAGFATKEASSGCFRNSKKRERVLPADQSFSDHAPVVVKKEILDSDPWVAPASTKHLWRHVKRTTSLWSNRTGSVLPGHARIWKKNESFSVKTLFIRASRRKPSRRAESD